MENLHNNFILIHGFLHPEEPLKKWVQDDENYTGEYHSSWDWLMAVVEKIESIKDGIYQVDIKQEGCIILERCKNFNPPISKTVLNLPEGTTKIEAVYLAVVEFIKLYNLNK